MEATFVQYVRFVNLFTNDISLPILLERLSPEGGTAKNLGLPHFYFLVLHISRPEDVELMDATRTTSSNPYQELPIPCSFLLLCRQMYGCRGAQVMHGVRSGGPVHFLYFMSMKFQVHSHSSRTFKHLFSDNMRLSEYDPPDISLR